MRLTLSQLESFCWIARLGTFRAAAGRCNRTQATVSLRIHELETNLGVKLFDRSGQKARLTSKGAELLEFAEQILGLAEQIEEKAHENGGMHGVIRLGAIDSFAVTCLSDLLGSLAQDNPQLEVEVVIDHSVTIARKLDARELDVALLLDPEVGEHVIVEPLCEVPVSWVAAPSLPFPQRVAEPFDLANTLIFSLPPPATTYTDIQRWFGSSGVEPGRISTCSSLQMIIPFVAAGLGISLLPRPLTASHVRDGTLRQLVTHPAVPARRICIAYQADRMKGRRSAVITRSRELALQQLAG